MGEGLEKELMIVMPPDGASIKNPKVHGSEGFWVAEQVEVLGEGPAWLKA